MMRGGSMYFVLWLKKPRNFEGISKDKFKKKKNIYYNDFR